MYLGSIKRFPFPLFSFLANVCVNLNPVLREVSAADLALGHPGLGWELWRRWILFPVSLCQHVMILFPVSGHVLVVWVGRNSWFISNVCWSGFADISPGNIGLCFDFSWYSLLFTSPHFNIIFRFISNLELRTTKMCQNLSWISTEDLLVGWNTVIAFSFLILFNNIVCPAVTRLGESSTNGLDIGVVEVIYWF